jgi:quercetin dioxygenase-like cupin family protein
MRSWHLATLELQPHAPAVLSTSSEGRAIVLEVPAGESLQEHQVHERAWVTVIDGEVEITAADGERITGETGLLIEFDPAERHAVVARTTARLLLLLAPWPGDGHPGTMDLDEKATVRERAAEHAS